MRDNVNVWLMHAIVDVFDNISLVSEYNKPDGDEIHARGYLNDAEASFVIYPRAVFNTKTVAHCSAFGRAGVLEGPPILGKDDTVRFVRELKAVIDREFFPKAYNPPMTEPTQPQDPKPAQANTFELDLNDETPLPKICDLSEDGTCEACQ